MDISNMEIYLNLKIRMGAREFLRKFISLSSSYMFSPRIGKEINDENLQLAIMYDRNTYQKILALDIYGKDNGVEGYKPGRTFALLKYLSVNPMAFYIAITSRIVKDTKEAWAPKYLSWAHRSAKKMTPLIKYCDLYCNSQEYNVYQDIESVALTLAALTSGVHRNALSLRQVATQWVALKLACSKSDKILLSKLLVSLLMDTLIWLPVVLKYKAGVYGSEFIHSIAASFLIGLTRLSEQKINFLKENLRGLEEWITTMKYKSYSQAVVSISNKIKCILSTCIKSDLDPLLGRLAVLDSKTIWKEKLEKLEKNKYRQVALLLTEQSGPAQIVFLLEKLKDYLSGNVKLILFYTQQTLWNRLLISDMEKIIEELLRDINVHVTDKVKYIPIATASPLLIRKIISSCDFKDTLVLIQGPLIPSILLVLYSEKDNSILI
ncbi:MAG: hypothetical protein ACTSSP_02475 [Candidatus Asgardarchaeia archaeon]